MKRTAVVMTLAATVLTSSMTAGANPVSYGPVQSMEITAQNVEANDSGQAILGHIETESNPGNPDNGDDSTAAQLTSEEMDLFDAIVFGQGHHAEEWGISAPVEIDERFIQEAKKELLSAHGAEIQSALAKMSTGDVNETEVGMDELHKIIVKFTESKVGPLDNSDSGEVSPLVCTPAHGCAVGWYLYAAVVVHNTMGVTALIGVLAGTWTEVAMDGVTAAAADSGETERIVANITRAMR